MKYDVFICYSVLDHQVADAICSRLEKHKIMCWIAPRDIQEGSLYNEEVNNAIFDCVIVVVVLSENAKKSVTVKTEIEKAVSGMKIIIAFSIDDVLPTNAMDIALCNAHWIDANTSSIESHFVTLEDSIKYWLNTVESLNHPLTPESGTIPNGKTNLAWLNKTSYGPGQRMGFGMVYDFNKEVILLHGGIGDGNLNDCRRRLCYFIQPHLGDIWIWNGSSWRFVVNNSMELHHHTLAHNKSTKQNIIYGGWCGTRSNNTFLVGENDSINLKTTKIVNPGERDSHSMAYDGKRKALILFGGFGLPFSTSGLSFIVNDFEKFDDTWEFKDLVWTKLDAKGPVAREGHKMVYDENFGVIVLFGGEDGSDCFNDTWIWEGNTATWTKILTQNAPSARKYHAMTYDSVNKKVLLFGGQNSHDVPLNDLWEWNGSEWKLLTEHAPPKPRYGHGFVYDEKRNKTILFGGTDGKEQFDDTWEFTY